jgi:hypothetical protein
MKKYRWWLLSAAVLALVANAADTPKPNESHAVMVGFGSNMKVGIDQQTGKLRQLTEEESRQLGAQPKFNAQAYSGWRMVSPPDEMTAIAQARTLANGAVAMKLPEENQSSLRASIDANGKLVFSEGSTVTQPEAVKEELSHE